jgi:predicted nucleic acid-binding protein
VAYLIDTSILARLANAKDARYGIADRAVRELHQRGEGMHVTSQVLVEFWNVATRPVAMNGLGLSAVDTEAQVAGFEAVFSMFPEDAAIYPAWKALVVGMGIVGKQVHDARLVAVCHVHKVTHLLTFNVVHFARMAGFGPGVVVVDPATV